MELLKTLFQKQTVYLAAVLGFIFVFSGCSLSGIDSKNQDITQEDLEVTSQIIGESLSDESSGAMSSLNDAIATFSDNGFESQTPAKSITGNSDDDGDTGRGSESNFSYNYDPDTGIHTVAFSRSITRGDFSKSVIDTLKYIFTDNQGAFIVAPRQNRDRVETIDFKGYKEGNVNLPHRTSFFVRTDTFLIDGLSDASATIAIDGVHNGEGNFVGTRDNGSTVERNYNLEINFLNIQVDKALVESNQSLEQGVTGSLSYEINIEKTNNGSTSAKTIVGTVEFNGDGTALLRFEGFQKLFHINLDNGDVRDGESEFEGGVVAISADRSTIKLSNSRRIHITNNAEIEFDDGLSSLEDVAEALDNGEPVRAEGEGTIRNGNFMASEIEFEIDADSDDSDETRIEVDMENSGEDSDASGDARWEKRSDRTRFDVEVEDLNVGSYDLVVGDSVKGQIEVVTVDGGTEGDIEFRNPADDQKPLLDFDPRGQLIEIVQDGTVYLSIDFPTEPTDN